MLDDNDSLVEYLLKKNNVNLQYVQSKLDESISRLAKTSGGQPAQNVSRDLNNVLLYANSTLKQFNDEFVSAEHLLLAIAHGSDDSAKLLKDAG